MLFESNKLFQQSRVIIVISPMVTSNPTQVFTSRNNYCLTTLFGDYGPNGLDMNGTEPMLGVYHFRTLTVHNTWDNLGTLFNKRVGCFKS